MCQIIRTEVCQIISKTTGDLVIFANLYVEVIDETRDLCFGDTFSFFTEDLRYAVGDSARLDTVVPQAC